MMARPFSLWHSWWCRPCAPHALAVTRIFFCAWLFVFWSVRLLQGRLLFSSEAIAPVLPIVPLTAPPPAVVTLLILLLLTALLLGVMGKWTRASLISAFLLYGYFWLLLLNIQGIDTLYLLCLGILACSDCGNTWSCDAVQRGGGIGYATPARSILPQRLLMLQIGAIYLGAGLQKLWLPDWQSGDMLWYTFIGNWGTDLSFWIARHGRTAAYDYAVIAVKCVEISLPFLLCIRSAKLRWVAAGIGTGFHLLIWLLIGLWQFGGLPAFYVLFVEPEEVETYFEKKRQRIERKRGS